MRLCSLLALVACLCLVGTSGCLPPKAPVYGFVYMDVKSRGRNSVLCRGKMGR